MVESRRAHSVVRGTRIGRSDRKHGCLCHRFSFFLLLSFFFLFLSVTREGVSRGTRGGDTPPTPCFMASHRTTGPGDRKRGGDVHGQNVPLSTSVDTPSNSRDFLPWRHWSSIRSRRNARGSCPTGREAPTCPSTGIADWEPSTTAPRDALYSLREDDKQSGADEERGPDVKTFSSCTSFHEDR